MNTAPFSLRIFVADGDPDGLRIVDKSNWIGKALVFPLAPLSREQGVEFMQNADCINSVVCNMQTAYNAMHELYRNQVSP